MTCHRRDRMPVRHRPQEVAERASFVWNGFTILRAHTRSEWTPAVASAPRGASVEELER